MLETFVSPDRLADVLAYLHLFDGYAALIGMGDCGWWEVDADDDTRCRLMAEFGGDVL